MAHNLARATSSITPVATPLAQKSQKKSIQPLGNVDPQGNSTGQQHRRDSPQSARIADIVPNMIPEAITKTAAVEVRRVEGVVAAFGKESPHAKPALKAAKAKHQRPDRVNHTVFGTSQEEVGAGRSRGRHNTEGPMCCRCSERRLERLQDSGPFAMQQEPA